MKLRFAAHRVDIIVSLLSVTRSEASARWGRAYKSIEDLHRDTVFVSELLFNFNCWFKNNF